MRKRNFLQKLNPFGMIRYVSSLGFVYKWYQILGIYAGIVLAAILVWRFYQLQPLYAILFGIFMALMMPEFVRRYYERKYQYKRFGDATSYMEQMMYSFKNTPKVHDCLLDIKNLYEEGEMKEAIQKAINVIENASYTDEDEEDLNHKSLGCIESVYPNTRIRNLHEFMCEVDSNGGDYDLSINMLLEDRNNWVKSMENHRQNMLSERKKVIIASGIVMVLSSIPNYLISKMLPPELQIGKFPLYNIITLVALMMILFIIAIADKRLAKDWLDTTYKTKQSDMEELYKRTVNWNQKKERNKSILFAAFPGAAFLVCFFVKSVLGMSVAGLLTIFMLNQHKIGHRLNRKNVTRFVKIEFPNWLLRISLYLQTDSVKVAIYNSISNAPKILKPALEEFIQELDESPESSKPYLDFMKYFNIPEVKSSMKMLYSISSTGSGDIKEQISNIIGRTNDMVLKAEELRQEDELAGMMALMLAPMLPMIILFITGLVAFVLAFFSMSLI